MKDVTSAVEDLNRYMYEMFGCYQFTGERQRLLAGLFLWLLENEHDPMSVGEIQSAIKLLTPEIMEQKSVFEDMLITVPKSYLKKMIELGYRAEKIMPDEQVFVEKMDKYLGEEKCSKKI